MKTQVFVADSAADALARIRQELGPEAVVLRVRQQPSRSLARLWQRPRIEVVAGVPPKELRAAKLAELLQQITQLNHQLPPADLPRNLPAPGETRPSLRREPLRGRTLEAVLEVIGLLPAGARLLAEQVRAAPIDPPARNLGDELLRAGAVLEMLWRKTGAGRSSSPARTHVFVGPAGVGKTTCLSKWLAQAVLLGGRSARVWRLDGRAANTAEALSVYGEILGVPVDRALPQGGVWPEVEIRFVDVPGVDWRDDSAVAELAGQVEAMGPVEVHLVLNAAYEMPILLSQIQAFAPVALSDLIFTHLDDEPRWGKLWNVFAATKYAIAFLSAGQNVPGNFYDASARLLLPAEFF